MTEKLLGYRESIAAACPELAIETVELFRAGQNNGNYILECPEMRRGGLYAKYYSIWFVGTQ